MLRKSQDTNNTSKKFELIDSKQFLENIIWKTSCQSHNDIFQNSKSFIIFEYFSIFSISIEIVSCFEKRH